MGMLTQFLPQLGDPIPPKATASKPAATSAPAKPPAAVTDSQKPLAPMAQKAMEAIVNFNEESNPAAVRTLASVYLAPQWSQLDSAGQQTVVDTLMQRAKAFRGKTSSLGSGAMAGGIAGSVVGDALAPETGGLSMLIPVLASAVGGGAGNAVEQKLTTGKINPKAMAIAGAEQGGGELAGQGLQSGAKALMTSAFGVKALSAADRAIGDISERFGLGAGAPEIGGRFRRLVELFGSHARTKGIQDAAAMAASKQLSSLGAAQADTALTRDALRDTAARAERSFSNHAATLWDAANQANAGVSVPLSNSMRTVADAMQGKAFGDTAGFVTTPASSAIRRIAATFLAGVDRFTADQVAPEAKAVAAEVEKALNDPRVLGGDPQLAKFGPALAAAMQSGDIKEMQRAASALMERATALRPQSSLIDPATGKPMRIAVDNGLSGLKTALDNFTGALSKARANPTVPFAEADQTLKELSDFRPDPNDADPGAQERWAKRLSGDLGGDIDRATAKGGNNAAWKAARKYYHNASSFREGLGKQVLEGKLEDIGASLSSPATSDQDVASLFNAFDQLEKTSPYGHAEAEYAKDRARIGMMQSMLGDPQGAGLATRAYLAKADERHLAGWGMNDLADLPAKVAKVSPAKLDAIFGKSGPQREAFNNLVDIGKVVNRIPTGGGAQLVRWLHYPVMMGLGMALSYPFHDPNKSVSSNFMSVYAEGAVGGLILGRMMAYAVTSPEATRFMLSAVKDGSRAMTATAAARELLLRSAAANAARFAVIVSRLVAKYQASDQMNQIQQMFPAANPAKPGAAVLSVGGGQ